MRAPLSWLREYVNVDATAHEIAPHGPPDGGNT